MGDYMFDCDFRDDTNDGIYCKKICNIVNSAFCDSCPLDIDEEINEYLVNEDVQNDT